MLQRRLLRAVEALPEGAALRVAPAGTSESDGVCLRRAARGLVQRGHARAVYRRVSDGGGPRYRRLCLVPVDSPVLGDALPLGSPSWVTPAPATVDTFGPGLVAAMVEHIAGAPVSASTASRWLREHREAISAAQPAVLVT